MKIKIQAAVNATLTGRRLHARGNIRMTKTTREIVIEGLPTDNGAAIVNNFTFGGGKYRVGTVFGNVGHIGNVGNGNVIVNNGNVVHQQSMFSNNNCIIGSQIVTSSSKKRAKSEEKDVTIDVDVEGTIEKIDVSGASTLTVLNSDTPFADRVDINVSSSSTVRLANVTISNLHARISSSASLAGSYSAKHADVHASSCGLCFGLHITGDGDLKASSCASVCATCVDKKQVSKEANSMGNISLSVASEKPVVTDESSESSEEIVVVASKKIKK